MRRIVLIRLLGALLCVGLLLTSLASITHRHEARSVRTCEACLHAPAPALPTSTSAAVMPPEFLLSTLAPEDASAEPDPFLFSSPSRAPPA